MQNIKVELIGKSLEQERDYLLQETSIIHKIVLQRQINTFFSVYFLSISAQENKNLQTSEDILKLYRTFYHTKFNGVRFLLELFLASLYILDDETKSDYKAFSLCLSERINEHKELDLYMMQINPKKKEHIEKIKRNESELPLFLNKFMPAGCSVESDLNTLVQKVSNKNMTDEANLGFIYSKNNKINFGNIMEQSNLLKSLIKELQDYGLLPLDVNGLFLKRLYFALSNQTHPTVTGITDFEIFIGSTKEKKIEIINRNMHECDTWLKVVGVLMDGLFKSVRKFDLRKINY